jgi:hypothetical protein
MKQGNCRICNEVWNGGKDLGLFTLRKVELLRIDCAFQISPTVIVGFGYPRHLCIEEKDSSIRTEFLELKKYSTVLLY